MSSDSPAFQARAIRPLDCVRGGWQLIKNDYWLFLGISFIGAILGAVAFGVLMGPAMCGIYLCLLRRARGQTVTFEMFFKGFDYFVQGLIAWLIIFATTLVLMLPVFGLMAAAIFAIFVNSPSPPPGTPPDFSAQMWTLLVFGAVELSAVLVALLLSILFFFVFPLIVDRGLPAVEAVRLSLRAAWANLGGVLLLMVLLALMSLAGLMACYVGAIFVLPIHYAAIAVAYRKVFPPEEIAEVLPVERPPPGSEGIRQGTPP